MNKSEIAAEIVAGIVPNTKTAFGVLAASGIKLDNLPDGGLRDLAAALVAAGGNERDLTMTEIEAAATSAGAEAVALLRASNLAPIGVPAHLPYWVDLLCRKDVIRAWAPDLSPVSVAASVAAAWTTSEEVLERTSLGSAKLLLCANAGLNRLRQQANDGADVEALKAGIAWLADMTATCIRLD